MKVIVRSQNSAKYNITQDINIVKVTQPKNQTIVNIVVDLKNSIKIIDSYGNILLDKIDGGIL